ncbi:coiled-coil domain-containing protein [Deinococcus multiflagellatus]|uniref:hypothetical protein n=1 Tax=Deinococcus multiflagellatus TaxID=1656887 RepID=UPI001CCB66ED|nr:hypothetical protein [Deinococcus multiflagellatus]MBZ9712470.1 hypothetical protein [Deinococcus multiflagellatus]
MPQLTKLRLVNVGHPKARFDDVTIPLHDPAGRGVDTTLWLRNGGGKSSMLNLFFSLLQPNRRQFLGKAGQHDRALEDYVLPETRAVIVAEWQLDTPKGDPPQWYLTGAFYEWSAREANTLERLFFAARVQPPRLTLDQLPLRDERQRPLTLHGFKQAWQNLTKAHPSAEGDETHHLHEWQGVLEKVRIDPELFGYQRVMNAREGGAEDLFRFRESDEFVNFFLGLAMKPTHGQAVARNLAGFREGLRERLEQHLPGLDLIRQLHGPVQDIQTVGIERQAACERLGAVAARLELTGRHAHTRQVEAETAIADLDTQTEQAQEALGQLKRKKQDQLHHWRALERRQLVQQTARLRAEASVAEQHLRDAEHAREIWRQAPALLDVERHEEQLRVIEALLQAQDEALAPDWADVRRSARQLAGALLSRAQQGRTEAGHRQAEAAVLEQTAAQAAQEARGARKLSGRTAERAQTGRDRLGDLRWALQQLREGGTLGPEEALAVGLARWQHQQADATFNEEALQGEQQLLEQQTQVWREQHFAAQRHCHHAAERYEQACAALLQAREARQAMANHPVLTRLMDNEPDLIPLSNETVQILIRARTELERQLLELRAQQGEEARVLEALRVRSLLPPTRDVAAVCQLLEEAGLACWSGWEHVAQQLPRSAARPFIERAPELVQGVLVRDQDLERARRVLLATSAALETPVVVAARQQAFSVDPGQEPEGRFLVGPTSDAHFDADAGAREAVVRELRLERLQAEQVQVERERQTLREALDQLETYLQRHPPGFFEAREAEVTAHRAAQQAAQDHLSDLSAEQHQRQARLQELSLQLEACRQAAEAARQHRQRLETHLERHGDERQERELEDSVHQDERQAQALEQQADHNDERARTAEGQARHLLDLARHLERGAAAAEHEARAVPYLEPGPLSATTEDVETCRGRHRLLCEALDQKTLDHQLRLKRQAAQEGLQAARERFERSCPSGIQEPAVRRALDTLADKERVHEQARAAEVHRDATFAEAQRLRTARYGVTEQLAHHEREYSQLKWQLTSEEDELSEEALLHLAQEVRRQALQTEDQEAQCRDQLEHLQKAKRAAEPPLRFWQEQRAKARGLTERYQELLQVHPSAAPAKVTLRDQDVAAHLGDLAAALDHEQQRWQDLTRRQEAAGRTFFRALSGRTVTFVKELLAWTPEDLELNAGQLREELEIRQLNIEGLLQQFEQHREVLITETLALAERGMTLLRGLAAHSTLPEGAGRLTGQRFLKITLPDLPPQAERRARIGALLDDIVLDRAETKGAELVQRAVRKLAQPIRVEVLFPDVDAPPRYLPITAMAKESGGERLTSAVLLYCTLARQRARERGLEVQATGTLLLDNPVGAASRVKLLQLQREMARAMSIQLIYATGVQDMEAVGTMPNVVQLRNEKHNLKTGHRLVELARLGRHETEVVR